MKSRTKQPRWICAGIAPLVMMLFLVAPATAQPPRTGLEGKLNKGGTASPSGSALVLARVKYSGGGDWYNDQSAEANLLDFVSQHTGINVRSTFEYVELSSDKIFNYPLLFLTGHGNIAFTDGEAKRLRSYLDNGGFLYIDDDYGLDTAVRREMRKVFPDQEFQELPFSHGIYSSFYKFPNGLPKIHEHDAKPSQGFGYYLNGRLCVYYTYETNISDGWAEPREHDDPPAKREEAFKMGTNIIVYVLNN